MTEKPIVDPKLAQELFEIVENRGELRMFTAPMVTNIEPPDIQLFCHSETCRTDSAELYQALDEEKNTCFRIYCPTCGLRTSRFTSRDGAIQAWSDKHLKAPAKG
jgi:hypothetical protein